MAADEDDTFFKTLMAQMEQMMNTIFDAKLEAFRQELQQKKERVRAEQRRDPWRDKPRHQREETAYDGYGRDDRPSHDSQRRSRGVGEGREEPSYKFGLLQRTEPRSDKRRQQGGEAAYGCNRRDGKSSHDTKEKRSKSKHQKEHVSTLFSQPNQKRDVPKAVEKKNDLRQDILCKSRAKPEPAIVQTKAKTSKGEAMDQEKTQDTTFSPQLEHSSKLNHSIPSSGEEVIQLPSQVNPSIRDSDIHAFKEFFQPNEKESSLKLNCSGILIHQSIRENWIHDNAGSDLKDMEFTSHWICFRPYCATEPKIELHSSAPELSRLKSN